MLRTSVTYIYLINRILQIINVLNDGFLVPIYFDYSIFIYFKLCVYLIFNMFAFICLFLRDSISSKACPRNCDAPSKPISAVTPQSKTNDYVPPTLSTPPVAKLENSTRDVPAPTPAPAPAPAPAQLKASSPLPVLNKNVPRVPVAPPQKPVVKESPPVTPMSFEKMEQVQELKSRSGTASPKVPQTPVSNNLSENTRPPPPRSPVPVSPKVENVPRTNLNFVKRENSYSSDEEEEEDENDEEEEDDSEIERIDLHSKY